MTLPDASDVLDLLGRNISTDQVDAALTVVTSMARSYTRDSGFTNGVPNEQIGAVVLAATCRLLANPGQLPGAEAMGVFSVSYGSAFTGWTLAETFVLDRYRVKAR